MGNLSQLVSQLKPVQAGQSVSEVVTASRINAIQMILAALVRGDNIVSGYDLLKSSTGSGVVLRANTKRSMGGGGGSPTLYPFDVTFTAGTPPDIIATVRPGTINGLIPSNYATTYTFSGTSTQFLVLSVVTTDGSVTGATLSMGASAPAAMPVTMGAPPATFSVLIGIVVSGVWFRLIGSGGLSATSAEVFRTDKVTPTPGLLPYDSWWSWTLGTA